MAPSLSKLARNAVKYVTGKRKSSRKEAAATNIPPNDVLPWGSDQILKTSDITKMCLRIPVNWSVCARDFEIKNFLPDSGVPEKHLKKQVFRIYGLPNLRFSLNLDFSEIDKEYIVTVRSDYAEAATFSVELEYAFVTMGYNVYHLATSPKFVLSTVPLTYDNFKRYNRSIYQWGYVTVYCVVKIETEVSSTLIGAVNEDGSNRIDIECEIGRSSGPINEDIKGALLGSIAEDFLQSHHYSGEINSLDVDIAKFLVRHGQKIGVPHLAALSVEYLKKNLTAGNVLDVLKMAHIHHIQSLTDACVHFLYEKCRAIIG